MKKFNFLENLLRREFAMSGMSGMNGLRADAVNPDSQPTVNRQSRLTSVQRHDSVTSARVAREWLNGSTHLRVWPLKIVAVLAILLTLGIGNVWGGTATITEDFEKQSASTTYNSTQTYTAANSNAGIAWFVEHGTVSTNSYLDGSKSMHMRAYYAKSSASGTWNGNLPYVNSTTDVKGLISITFNAAVSNTGLKMDVMYSTNSGSSWSYMYKTSASSGTNASAITFSNTSKASYTYYIPSAALSPTGNFRIKIAVNSGSTHASKPNSAGNYTFRVDNIAFTYTAYTVTYNGNGNTSGSVPTDATKYTSGSTVTVKSNSGSLAKTGHTFGGWNTQADGNGTNYTAGSGTFTITADKTLYAKWDAESCTAPNHVDIAGAWDRFAGEQISLTATAYSSAGTGSPISAGDITGYQWYKGGTAEGNKIAGATSATYTKDNCNLSDAGDYYCKISTGATCSTMSSAFGVKVYALDCYTGGTATHNFTRVGATQTGTLELPLTASTGYEFKVRQGAVYLGNNGTINEDENTWDFTTSGDNVTVNSGLGGTFTFTLDYSSNADAPIMAVTYPRKTIYLVANSDWLSNSAKFAYYYYSASGAEAWTDFIAANECGMSAEIPQWNGLNVIAVRFNSTKTSTGNWDDKWNQTDDITITSDKNLITITGWNNSQTYTAYTIPTYAISYNKGTNGVGTRDNDTKTCGTAFTLPNTQVFTRSGYTMDGWATSDGGDKAYNLGGSYTTNAAQTFYPHWAIVNYTITYNLNGGTQQVSPAPATSYNINSSAITLPTPTREGYDFAGWYANSDLSTGGVQTTIAAGSTGNKTYWAKWTTLTDTYKTALHTDSTGWTSYATGVTKSGAGYTIPAPSSVKKGATSSCEHTHYYFAGWVADEYKGSPADHIIAATGTTDATGTTYWAVWKKEGSGGGGTSSITITRSTTGITATGYGSGVERTWTQSEIDFGGHYIMTNNANTPSGASASQYIVMQKSNGTLYNTEELPGAITEVEVIQYSALACNVYCGDERLMASDNTSTGQTPSGTLITKPDDATTMTWTISASNNYRFFALKAYTSSSSGTNYITSVKVTYTPVSYEDPKVVCEACAADPVMTSAASALKGDFSLTSVGVTATGWNPGTNCSWDEKGFVWGSSTNPTVSNNKVIVATGTDATWDGALVPSNSTTPKTLAVGTTYHFRAYGKNGKDAAVYVYSADVSFTPRSVTCGSVTGGTISAGTEVSAAGKTITLTATPANSHFTFNSWTIKKTSDNSDVTSSVSLSGQTSSATFTMPDYNVTITASFDEDAHATVNFYNAKNGNTPVSSIHVYEDEKPTPPTLTDGTSGDACDATSDKHYGWSTAKWNNTYATAELMNAAQTVYTKGSNLPAIAAGDLGTTIDYYAVWAVRSGSAAVTKTDEFTYTSFFDACTSSGANVSGAYTNFSSISGSESEAVYAGNLMRHGNGPSNCKDYIQMRSSNSTSGLITTTTGGTAKKITVDWSDALTTSRTINVYGKNSAYSTAADLYDEDEDGDILGTIVFDYSTPANTTTELTITGDYSHIGIRSNDGAIFLNSIDIDWSTGGGYTYSTFLTTCCEDPELTVTDEGDDDNITLVREDIHGVHGGNGSATVEQGKATLVLDYTTSSSGTCTVEVKKLTGANNRATDGGSDCSNHTSIAINTSTKKITFEVWTYAGSYPTANGQGTYRIKITQAAASTYCDAVTYYFVDVTLRDKFVDAVNGNTTINVDGQSKTTSDYSKTPTESSLDADKNDDCHSTTRRLLGWVREDNMNTWYGSSSDRTANLDDKSADAALVAPNANIITTGSTWYAVWGEEVK